MCPSIWNQELSGDVQNFVLAIMYLLFLGVTSTTGAVLRDTFINRGKYTKFWEMDIMKHMRTFSLSWCRAWTYGSNKTPYGPWTAENYLAYSRIFKYAYSVATSIFQTTIITKNE